MSKIRVLVVDDSTAIRRLISDVLSSDPQIEVVGVAANGKIALEKLPQVNPDIVTLDVEMPELDGLETLTELRKSYPTLPVIMFSTATERGAVATIDALSCGASDYVTKPSGLCNQGAALQYVFSELLPRIKALTGRSEVIGGKLAGSVVASPLPVNKHHCTPEQRNTPEVVAIGASTGGPAALLRLLPSLPANLQVPILIVQHMLPLVTRAFAKQLGMFCQLPIEEARDGAELKPQRIWLAPGGKHLVVRRNGNTVILQTNENPPENLYRPSVDVLFRSIAETYGARSLGVVLSGMGQDGLRGAEAIHEAGGQIIAQDQESSLVWGMPGTIVKAGLAHQILPLSTIGLMIARECCGTRVTNEKHRSVIGCH